MSKKFIKLKDKQGNILYPSAYKDDLDQIIRKTYLTKTGRDSYIYKAWVETYQSSEGEIIQKLILVNRNDPDNPIEFYGSGSSAIWGLITGDIDKQVDLTAKISSSIELQFVKKNKIYIQDFEPVNTSEITLIVGDMWYVTGPVSGYTEGKWYTYNGSYWDLVADKDIAQNSLDIKVNAEGLRIEAEERRAGEAATHSIIEQTAQGIMTVVETKNTVYRQDEAPEMSSEHILYEGDLWFCTDEYSTLYKYNKWYIYKDGRWKEATDNEILINKSSIEQTNGRITTEVKRLDGDIATTSSKIDQTAKSITLLVESKPKIFEGLEPPVSTEEHTIVFGDLWLCTNTESSEYINNCYYRYNGYSWVETTNPTVETAITQLNINDGKIEADVKAVDGRVSSVKQTADGVQAEVTNARGDSSTLRQELNRIESSIGTSIQTSRGDTPPETKAKGDLWFCTKDYTEGSSTYVANHMYRWTGSIWELVDLAPDQLNTLIGQYVDSEAGTSKVVLAASGTYLSKSDAADTYETITNVANLTETVSSQGASIVSVTQTVSGHSTKIASINQSVTQDEAKIALVVTSSGSTNKVNSAGIVTAINDSGSTVKINADKIQMTGTTTFLKASDVGSSGSTTISGDRITTGKIKADYIGLYGLMNVYVASNWAQNAGQFGYQTSTGITLTSTFTDIAIAAGSSRKIEINTNTSYYNVGINCVVIEHSHSGAALRPRNWTTISCGTSSNKWKDVWATNGTIQTSDRNKKKDINYSYKMDEFFDDLKPCSFKMIEGQSGRTHYGLIAQDIEVSLNKCGLSAIDFAGFCKDPKYKEVTYYEDDALGVPRERTKMEVVKDEYEYSLRYDEFISLCIDQIHKLKKRVKELENAK